MKVAFIASLSEAHTQTHGWQVEFLMISNVEFVMMLPHKNKCVKNKIQATICSII